jgi:hypothetical protein
MRARFLALILVAALVPMPSVASQEPTPGAYEITDNTGDVAVRSQGQRVPPPAGAPQP